MCIHLVFAFDSVLESRSWQGVSEFQIMTVLREGGLKLLQEANFKDVISVRLVRLCCDVAQELSNLQSDGVALFDGWCKLERIRTKDFECSQQHGTPVSRCCNRARNATYTVPKQIGLLVWQVVCIF